MGIIPLDCPFVPFIIEFLERTLWICNPIPPAYFEILAQSCRVLKIPSKLSSSIANKKQEDSWGFTVPELNKVGVAWVKYFKDNIIDLIKNNELVCIKYHFLV